VAVPPEGGSVAGDSAPARLPRIRTTARSSGVTMAYARMSAEPIEDYVITEHAAFEMQRRNISDGAVRQVMHTPDQRLPVRQGRVVLQSRTVIDQKSLLLRVFVDIDRIPAEVVTVYVTSKIAKYWSASHEN
jgi:hypothetical protein